MIRARFRMEPHEKSLYEFLWESSLRPEFPIVVEDDTLLTDRQRECLQAALRLGYFEVPRECTLAELADRLGVDKSTASETIRRGQTRLVKSALLERTRVSGSTSRE